MLVFRSQSVFATLDFIFKSHADQIAALFLEKTEDLLLKLPQGEVLLKESDDPISPNHNIQSKIRTLLKLLLQHRQSILNAEEFTQVVTLFCSARVMNRKYLFRDLKVLEECVYREGEASLQTYFEQNFDSLAKRYLYNKNGILSKKREQRETSINILSCIGHYGMLDRLAPLLQTILDPKSFELFSKLGNLMKSKFDFISHFSLIFYAQVSADLLKEGEDLNQDKKEEEAPKEEEKKEEPKEEEKKEMPTQMDTAALM